MTYPVPDRAKFVGYDRDGCPRWEPFYAATGSMVGPDGIGIGRSAPAGPIATTAGGGSASTLSPIEREVCRQLELDEATFAAGKR